MYEIVRRQADLLSLTGSLRAGNARMPSEPTVMAV